MPGRPGVPGRWPAARPGRCRRTAAVPPERPPTTPAKEAYMPAGPGSGPAHLGWPGQGGVAPVVGQLPEDVGDIGGGQLQPGVAEGEAGDLAGGPRSAPAPAVAPRPTARSWSPGLVNGGRPTSDDHQAAAAARRHAASIHLRLGRARRVDCVIDEALKDDPWDEQAVTDADGRKPACRDLAVKRHQAHVEPACCLATRMSQAAILAEYLSALPAVGRRASCCPSIRGSPSRCTSLGDARRPPGRHLSSDLRNSSFL